MLPISPLLASQVTLVTFILVMEVIIIFQIYMYRNKSEPNKLGKTISPYPSMESYILEGTLKEGTDVVNPIILIEWGGVAGGGSVPKFNYLMIPTFGRYYFVRKIETYRNNLWYIHCHVDVLDSYQSVILEQKAMIARTEYGNNLMLDNRMPANLVTKDEKTIEFKRADNLRPFKPETDYADNGGIVVEGMWGYKEGETIT